MRRRALLSGLAASTTALAGCSAFESSDRPNRPLDVEETRTEEPTTAPYEQPTPSTVRSSFTVPGDDDHVVAVTIPDDVPDGVVMTLGFSSLPDANSPATLYVEVLRPESAESPVELPASGTPPLGSYRGVQANTGRRLFLAPERAGVGQGRIVKRDRGCWRPRRWALPETTAGTTATDGVVLDPGESVAREYHLVTPWASDLCLQEGGFRFETDAGWSFVVASFTVDPPGGSQFADRTVPDLPGPGGTRWYHEAAPDGRLYLEPSSEQYGLSNATATFDCYNYLPRSVRVDAGAWALWKLDAGAWYRVAPFVAAADSGDDGDGHVDDGRVETVLPGGSRSLSLSLHADPDAATDEDSRAVDGLGDGTYAVAFPALRPMDSLDDAAEGGAVCAALVELVGPEATLSTSDAVDHARDDGRVRHLYANADESSVATLRLERRPDGPPETHLVTEQVLQRDALRDALAELHDAVDVDAVVNHVDASAIQRTTEAFDPDGDGLAFRYDGATYRTTYG